jgi:hypothetical protein
MEFVGVRPRRLPILLLAAASSLSLFASSSPAQVPPAETAEGVVSARRPGPPIPNALPAEFSGADDLTREGPESDPGSPVVRAFETTALPSSFSYYKVIGSAFQPRDSTQTYAYTSNGCIYQTAGGVMRFQAPLYLPEGSILKYLRLYYNDTATENMTAWITRYEPGQANLDLTSVQSTGAGGYGTTLGPLMSGCVPPPDPCVPLPPVIVDQDTYAYVLTWGSGVLGAGNQLCGIRIAYSPGPDGHYNSLPPCRVLDTRDPAGPTGGTRLANPGPHDFRIHGACGVPLEATAVVLNATVVAPSRDGDLRLFPTTSPQPDVSVLNYPGGFGALANGAIMPLGPVTVYPVNPSQKDLRVLIGMTGPGTIHLLFDVTGYYY